MWGHVRSFHVKYVMSLHDLCHVISCQCHFMSYMLCHIYHVIVHAMSCHVIWCLMPCYMSCHVKYHVKWCNVISCHDMAWHGIYHVMTGVILPPPLPCPLPEDTLHWFCQTPTWGARCPDFCNKYTHFPPPLHQFGCLLFPIPSLTAPFLRTDFPRP